MTTVVQGPRDCMPVLSEDWHLEGATPSVDGLFGPGTFIYVENRIWVVTLDLAALRDAQWRTIRTILDRVRGRFGVLEIPVRQPDPCRLRPYSRTFDRGRTFDDGNGFAAEDLSNVSVRVAADAGATELELTAMPSLIKLAAMFSLPGGRVHRIVGSTPSAVQIEPPLRRGVIAGDRAEFVAPVARMRLSTDRASVVRRVKGNARASNLVLEEAFQ